MDFHAYPGDVQACDIKMESFGTTTDQMLFQWARGGGDSSSGESSNNTFLLKSSRRKEKAVTAQFHAGILGGCNVNENISLAQFSVLVYIHSVCLSGWTLYIFVGYQ